MVGRICPSPGGNRVKVSENLGATSVALVAPAVTSLTLPVVAAEVVAKKALNHYLPILMVIAITHVNTTKKL